MALALDMTTPDGVPVSYHRVVSVISTTNVQATVEVRHYVSARARAEEAQATAAGRPMCVWTSTEYMAAPYGSVTDVSSAYEYLKGLPPYAGASDDGETYALDAEAGLTTPE